MTDMHSAAYTKPTYPLAYKPKTHWAVEGKHYQRQLCSYCLHPNYVYAPEEETGRYYCQACTKKNKFPIREQLQCICTSQGGDVDNTDCPYHDTTVNTEDMTWRKRYDAHRVAQRHIQEGSW